MIVSREEKIDGNTFYDKIILHFIFERHQFKFTKTQLDIFIQAVLQSTLLSLNLALYMFGMNYEDTTGRGL